jgi:hypothetical protein
MLPRRFSPTAIYCEFIDAVHDLTDPTIEALALQANACLTLGSQMYHDLLHVILDDYRSGGISHRILKDASDRPVHDATPLRLLGALHRIVLDGRDQQLARHYESVGGQATSSLKEDALSALEACESEIREALTQQVQTNEPGRSLCHLALSHWFAHLGIKDFDLLEVGASAGLTMSFDRYCLRLPEGVVGDPSSSLEFPPSWIETSFPFHESPALCRTRRGVDISPIDVTTDSGVNRLLSFVWPDQHDRFRRLRLAIELTRQQPHHIDKASVDTWLPEQLIDQPSRPVLVFHSIVWQYLSVDVQNSFRESLFEFGRRATATTPLIWARMEPAGRVADIQVTIWDGASVSDWNLGTIGYHGQSLQWSPTRRTQ